MNEEPQTLYEAWEAFVEATGYRRLATWLLDHLTKGLNWLTQHLPHST